MKKYISATLSFLLLLGIFLDSNVSASSRMVDFPEYGGYGHYYDGGPFEFIDDFGFTIVYGRHYVLTNSDRVPRQNAVDLIHNGNASYFSTPTIISSAIDPNTRVAYVKTSVVCTLSGYADTLIAEHAFDCDDAPWY